MAWTETSTGPASFGYYRGTPYFKGSGSGMGPVVSGVNSYAPGQGNVNTTQGQWTPTVLYLFVFVIVEMFFFGILSKHV